MAFLDTADCNFEADAYAKSNSESPAHGLFVAC